MKIYNKDCTLGNTDFLENSIDLIICDPPFGIKESNFDKHYKRKKNIIEGYQEAPDDYYKFSKEWIIIAKRILKQNGSMYIISGWSNSDIIGSVLRELNFFIRNKIIWKFDFGVNTKKKFVTSHYEIYYVTKEKKSNPTFNTYCRYGAQEKDDKYKSLLYQDLQSVWDINKEYQPGKVKNQNKLPEKLIKKMILYSSNEKDKVCDFFLGNFTTAIVSKKLGRVPVGYEINKNMFDIGIKNLKNTKKEKVEEVKNILPENQGKRIDKETIKEICNYFDKEYKNKTKEQIIKNLMIMYGRGKFSIKNIIDAYCGNCFREIKIVKDTELSEEKIIFPEL